MYACDLLLNVRSILYVHQPTNHNLTSNSDLKKKNNLKKAERIICLARFGYKHETRVCDSFYKALTNSETINNSRIKRFSHGLHRIFIFFLSNDSRLSIHT